MFSLIFRKENGFDVSKYVNEIKDDNDRPIEVAKEFEGIGFRTLYFACCQKAKKSERILKLVETLLSLGAGTCMAIRYLCILSNFVFPSLYRSFKM